jgi:predicted adenylyl cyclase CyaB
VGRNVEIKARVRDPEALRERIVAVCDSPPLVLDQEDTFFNCSSGRLKLRCTGPLDGELIHYDREDAPGPKVSRYVRASTSEPSSMLHLLSRAHGVLGVVRKTREVYLAGRIRIHVDDVAGLGSFVELEVVLSETESVADGERAAEQMMSALGIERSDLVEGAYIDLLTLAVPGEAPSTMEDPSRS